MNSLSLFLYFADAIPAVGTLLAAVAIIILAACAFFCLFSVLESNPIPGKPLIAALSCAFILLLISTLTPSKNTLYAIAASELGQKDVESELGGKALKALQQWIESQAKKATP